MSKKNTQIRLSEAYWDTFKQDFGDVATASSLIMESHSRLRAVSMNELKGYFSKEEITALVDSLNGTMLAPDFIYNKAFFAAQLEDFETLEHGISRHGAEPQDLIGKINALSHSQVFLLMLEISSFWNKGGDLQEFIGRLA